MQTVKTQIGRHKTRCLSTVYTVYVHEILLKKSGDTFKMKIGLVQVAWIKIPLGMNGLTVIAGWMYRALYSPCVSTMDRTGDHNHEDERRDKAARDHGGLQLEHRQSHNHDYRPTVLSCRYDCSATVNDLHLW